MYAVSNGRDVRIVTSSSPGCLSMRLRLLVRFLNFESEKQTKKNEQMLLCGCWVCFFFWDIYYYWWCSEWMFEDEKNFGGGGWVFFLLGALPYRFIREWFFRFYHLFFDNKTKHGKNYSKLSKRVFVVQNWWRLLRKCFGLYCLKTKAVVVLTKFFVAFSERWFGKIIRQKWVFFIKKNSCFYIKCANFFLAWECWCLYRNQKYIRNFI